MQCWVTLLLYYPWSESSRRNHASNVERIWFLSKNVEIKSICGGTYGRCQWTGLENVGSSLRSRVVLHTDVVSFKRELTTVETFDVISGIPVSLSETRNIELKLFERVRRTDPWLYSSVPMIQTCFEKLLSWLCRWWIVMLLTWTSAVLRHDNTFLCQQRSTHHVFFQVIARRGHFGSFLQDEWELIQKLVSVIHDNFSVPITCKLRIFEDVQSNYQPWSQRMTYPLIMMLFFRNGRLCQDDGVSRSPNVDSSRTNSRAKRCLDRFSQLVSHQSGQRGCQHSSIGQWQHPVPWWCPQVLD